MCSRLGGGGVADPPLGLQPELHQPLLATAEEDSAEQDAAYRDNSDFIPGKKRMEQSKKTYDESCKFLCQCCEAASL
jgi:hypothetical protein